MPRRLEPPYRFLVDECLGMHIVPDALESALIDGEAVIRFTDILERGAKDEVWLRKAGSAGYVIITKDGRIRFRPNERAALIESGAVAFAVGNAPGSAMAEKLVRAMPTIRRVLRGQKPPLFGTVLDDGSVSLSILDGEATHKVVKRPVG